ncbi:MAG: response regulator [Deltaproteobacteria bacterium]|nr:response regulator [Deltaproteobacteria bacterium]
MPRIMVVDDSSSMRAIVGKTLRQAAHDVVEATDGQNAIDQLAASPVDLVLCDVNMPRVDGLSLLRYLRTQSPPVLTPVLLLSAEADPRRIQFAKDNGASGWMIKPFKPEQLLATLRQILG